MKPPTTARSATRAIADVIDGVFSLAIDIVGSHAPWEIEIERAHLAATKAALLSGIKKLPKADLIQLGRTLWDLYDAASIELAQAEADWEAR